jgi:hypothetical protein
MFATGKRFGAFVLLQQHRGEVVEYTGPVRREHERFPVQSFSDVQLFFVLRIKCGEKQFLRLGQRCHDWNFMLRKRID